VEALRFVIHFAGEFSSRRTASIVKAIAAAMINRCFYDERRKAVSLHEA
jgi:hypothetical protein